MKLSRFLLVGVVLLLGLNTLQGAPKKELLLIGVGPDGHPAATHEYLAGLRILQKCLKDVPDLEIRYIDASGPWKDGPDLLKRADAVVLFVAEGARWLQEDPARLKALQQMAANKGGLTVLHWGMGARDAKYIDDFTKLFGGCHGGPDRKYQVLETKVHVADPKHPVLRGIESFSAKDEYYYKLKFQKDAKIQPLFQAEIDGNKETVAWAWERPDGGRSVGFSGLHFHDNWKLKEYRRLVTQGVVWTLGRDVPEKGMPVEVTEDDLKLKK